MQLEKKTYNAIIIGTSAGGKDAIIELLVSLPSKLNVPIVIVQHLAASSANYLATLLKKHSPLLVREVISNLPITAGVIYTAPANYHLLFSENNRFNLSVDPPYNFSRPSIDFSFYSALDVYDDKLIAIILSGANSDGMDGLKQVKEAGGLVIVQDPKTASSSIMPKMAIRNADPEFILSPKQIGEFLTELNINKQLIPLK
jgi:two-component system chemotaxis response regulator CheB